VAPQLFRDQKNWRQYPDFRLFRHGEIEGAFRAYGFGPAGGPASFSYPWSCTGCCAVGRFRRDWNRYSGGAGLSRRWGSPVIAEMVREDG